MSRSCIFACIILLLVSALCEAQDYQIPDVELEANGGGYNIFILDEPDVVKSVNYILEVNKKCPAIRNHLIEPNNGKWITKEIVHKNDNVTISLFVEVDSGTLKKIVEIIVSDKGVPLIVGSGETPNNCQPTCIPTETTFLGKEAQCAGELLFEETFDGQSKLDLSKWTHEIRSMVHSQNSELVAFDNQPENCYIEDGKLILMATWNNENKGVDVWDRCTSLQEKKANKEQECRYSYRTKPNFAHPPVFSSKVHTRKNVFGKYFKMVIRARLPIGDFLYPHILLQPMSKMVENAVVNYTRIAARGNKYLESNCKDEQMDGRILSGDIVYWDSEIKSTIIDRTTRSIEHFGEQFHNYTILWQRNSINFEVDGLKFGGIDTSNLHTFNSEEFFLVLGLTLGGELNFPNIKSTHAKAMKTPIKTDIVGFYKDKVNVTKEWSHPALEVDFIHFYATEKV